ncbi:MAG: type II toxin-antitoxin system VapC family toxin [SAR324 cluster bacterium]|nr:type II toxin-antitoxin system VapC family toxin [SAR324 cluster bacterium]
MKYLLDTHIWIWSMSETERLNPAITQALEDKRNQLFLSPISVWEALLLIEKDRIEVPGRGLEWIEEAFRTTPIFEIPLTIPIAIRSRQLQLPHQDPADRFIVATALEYGLRLITVDEKIIESGQVEVL